MRTNRRNLLRQLGATGIAATTLVGPTAAASSEGTEYGIGHEIDVSDVSGRVTLMELLSDEELDQLNDDIDPTRREFIVHDGADTVDIGTACVVCCQFWYCPASWCDGICECDLSCGA